LNMKTRTKKITIRLREPVDRALKRRSARDGKTVTRVLHDALMAYLFVQP